MLSARLVLSGSVQNVFCRDFTFFTAQRQPAEITGFVRNQQDGSVLVYCECENEAALEHFIAALRAGPRVIQHGKVKIDKIEIAEKKPISVREHATFYIDRT